MAAVVALMKPPPKINVAEWAEAHRYLARGTSAEAGKFFVDHGCQLLLAEFAGGVQGRIDHQHGSRHSIDEIANGIEQDFRLAHLRAPGQHSLAHI